IVRCESASSPAQAAALVTTTPTQCTVMPSVSASATAGPRRINAAVALTAARIFRFALTVASQGNVGGATLAPPMRPTDCQCSVADLDVAPDQRPVGHVASRRLDLEHVRP